MIYNGIIPLIGNTPLIRLERFSARVGAKRAILGKAERFNPCGSAKDRPALFMLEEGIKQGKIDSDTVIIEATSGNTGIALAAICACKGLECVIVMPENMSAERQRLISLYGARIVLTPASEGMIGAAQKAESLAKEYKKAFIPDQFSNPANPLSHYATTAGEIWNSCEGKIAAVVVGVGSGGSISGIARSLKERDGGIRVFAVEPLGSAVLSGQPAGSHGIQGIGAGYIPKNYDQSLVDGVIAVSDGDALEYASLLAKTEGLLCGISSGAALYGAREVSLDETIGDGEIVALLPDTGERYLSVF